MKGGEVSDGWSWWSAGLVLRRNVGVGGGVTGQP